MTFRIDFVIGSVVCMRICLYMFYLECIAYSNIVTTFKMINIRTNQTATTILSQICEIWNIRYFFSMELIYFAIEFFFKDFTFVRSRNESGKMRFESKKSSFINSEKKMKKNATFTNIPFFRYTFAIYSLIK